MCSATSTGGFSWRSSAARRLWPPTARACSCAYQSSPRIEAAALEAHFAYHSLNIFVECSTRVGIPYFPVNIETGEPHAASMALHHARKTVQAVVEPDLDIDAPFVAG